MALKNLLVHLTGQPTDRDRLAAALTLAGRHQARVDGFFISPKIHIPGYASASLPAEVFETHERELRAQAERIGGDFRQQLDKAGVSGDWYFRVGDIDEELARQAYFADLVVVGQRDERYNGGANASRNDYVVMNASGPLLFVPDIGAGNTIGDRVLIAWNGGMEAARAVRDALPLLTAASHVEVLAVNAASDEGEVPTADICLFLARHGVNAEASRGVAKGISVGDYLLSHAADRGSDLLVMGAYGHSRMFETILGGVTRSLLGQMTVPLLMSR